MSDDHTPEPPEKSEAKRRAAWASFKTHGRWVRGDKWQPTKPGRYFVATREGDVIGLREYRTDAASARVVMIGTGPNEPGWQGWIWDVGLPDAPACPVPEWSDT